MSVFHNRAGKMIVILIGLSMGWMVADISSAEDTDATKVVEVTASGTIVDKKADAAREQAIASGLVSAVALASVDLLPVEAQVENFEMLNQDLYDQVDNFIQNYKVLTEFVTHNQYRVVMRVTVMLDRVEKQLSNSGVILAQEEMSRILIFMAEQTLEEEMPTYWWGERLVFVVPSSEMGMADVLREKGFPMVKRSNLLEPLNYDLNLSAKEAISIGKHLTADIVIVGVSRAEMSSNVMSGTIKSYRGIATAKAYRTDTGDIIGAVSRTAVAAGEDAAYTGRKALANAGALTGEELAKQIIAARQRAAALVPSVEIEVIGTSELKNFVAFRKMLGTVPGVKGINIKEIKPNASTIVVEYSDSGETLADALMLKTYDSFGIDIYEVSPERLGIELIPN
jgi:ribosomal protein S25